MTSAGEKILRCQSESTHPCSETFFVCHDVYFLDQFTRDYCKYVGSEIRLLATEALTLTTDYDDCYFPENPKLR